MNAHDLIRRLERLRRPVQQLETELRRAHVDEKLIAEIETLAEGGIIADDRASELRDLVDALRVHTLISKPVRFDDAVRACVRLRLAIGKVIDDLG
jgi:hypothetical protein